MDPNLQTINLSDYKHILLKKLWYAISSSIVFQLVMLVVYIFALNFSIFAPASSMLQFAYTITSLSTCGYFIVFTSTVFAQCVIGAKDYIVNRRYSSTRYQKLKALLCRHNLALLLLHTIVGITCVWLFLSLCGSELSGLITHRGDKFFFSEDSFFLFAGGALSAQYYFAKEYTSEKKIMFPVVHQRKLLQFKANFFSVFKESKSAAFGPAFYYTVIYAFFGTTIARKFSSIIGTTFEHGENSFTIYFLMWAFCTIIFFYLNIMKFFYELFLTEPVKFPIASDSMTLMDAVGVDVPIIQHLACLDLFILCGCSPTRREAIFTLSQPGGHPHNWNKLVESVLKIITDFSEALNKSTTSILPKKNRTQSPQPPVKPPNYDKMRNMSFGQNTQNSFTCRPVEEHITAAPPNVLTAKLREIVVVLKERLGYNYVFEELPEANIQKCLGDGQVVMWVTQALASITVASLKEDRFGIVQKDLPVIISALVELKLSVERLNRIPALTRRSQGFEDFNAKMKIGILNSVKRSLFSICVAFGPYLKDFNLKKEVVAQLQTFIPAKLTHY